MKKVFWSLIINLVLLLILTFRPPLVYGVKPGDSCSVIGATSNCEVTHAVTGKKMTVCCGCDGNEWKVVDEGTCISTGAGEKIVNPVLEKYGSGEGAELLAKLIAQALSAAFIIAGVLMLIMILWSGIAWIMAGDNENNLKGAQKRLTNAIVGFAVVVALRAILGFIGGIFEVSWLQTLKIVWPTP